MLALGSKNLYKEITALFGSGCCVRFGVTAFDTSPS
jgi:hypothetical protein